MIKSKKSSGSVFPQTKKSF